MSRARPRLASGSAARPRPGLLRRVGRIALYGVVGFLIGSIVLVAVYRALPPPGTPLMLIRRVEGYGIDKSWRRLDDISPHLIRAAMAGEDARFCRHHGFDWGAVATAWGRYQSGHGRLLGASTISMQTAKNVFLWPGRDWLRKGFEAWFTTLIELAWGKRRIMEIYLNVAEWGPGVYGAEAAARHYFHKPADALNQDARHPICSQADGRGDIQRPLESWSCHARLKVRIRLAPAASLLTRSMHEGWRV
jgi:monofunctional biosynthetic peptidoglycan transglycosylase